MEPTAGDELIVDGDENGHGVRVATILAPCDRDGRQGYLVHWVTGDYDALICPWPGVRVRHRDHGQNAETVLD